MSAVMWVITVYFFVCCLSCVIGQLVGKRGR